jgi:recombination protein RecT
MENSFLAIKEYGRSPEIIERFAEIVGKHNAGGYVQSAILAVANNEALQKCTPQSIFASALRAATVQLLCEPSLGQAYLVPFKDKATFIIGYKGLYQLALRTGKYRFINVSSIYEGELIFEDRFTGEVSLEGGKTSSTVIGYLASFQLTSGFSKSFYMTVDEIHAHADKYSKSVNYATSPWKTNRVEMERKTVLRLLLSRYGYLDPKDAMAISDDPEADETLPEADDVTVIEGDSRTLKQVVSDLGFEENAAAYDKVLAEESEQEYWDEDESVTTTPSASMSIETANSVTTKDGVKLNDCSTSELEKFLVEAEKFLAVSKEPGKRESLLFKRDAIVMILNSRLGK